MSGIKFLLDTNIILGLLGKIGVRSRLISHNPSTCVVRDVHHVFGAPDVDAGRGGLGRVRWCGG